MKKLNIFFAALLSLLFVSCGDILAKTIPEGYYIESHSSINTTVTYDGITYEVNNTQPLFINNLNYKPVFDTTYFNIGEPYTGWRNGKVYYCYEIYDDYNKIDFIYKFINNSEKDIQIKISEDIVINKLLKNSMDSKTLKGCRDINVYYYVNDSINKNLNPIIQKSVDGYTIIYNIY